jgi:hypothetical protein
MNATQALDYQQKASKTIGFCCYQNVNRVMLLSIIY